jgi:hypothetical protein
MKFKKGLDIFLKFILRESHSAVALGDNIYIFGG